MTNTQEFAFGLYAQGYEFFNSHSTSASASVCVAVRKKLSMGISLVGNIPGRLIALDLLGAHTSFCVINVYALNSPLDWNNFFQDINNYITGKTILLGDFNSVTQPCDQ